MADDSVQMPRRCLLGDDCVSVTFQLHFHVASRSTNLARIFEVAIMSHTDDVSVP